MNPEDLLKLLEDAQAALAGSAENEPVPMHVVNDYIRNATGGEINGFMSLQLAIPTDVRRASRSRDVRRAAGDEQRDQQLNTFASVSPIRHFVEGAFQGATLEFGDEALEALGVDMGNFRARQEARRELNPGASVAAEMAGMLVPGGAGTAAARAGARASQGVGFLGSAGRMAGIGAVESGIIGAGGVDEGSLAERGQGAAVGAAFGAPFGALGPVLGRAARPFRTNRALARQEGREILEQTGKTAEEVFDEMRRLQDVPTFAGGPGRGARLVDVDPSIGARAPGIVKKAPGLRAAGGQLEGMQARVTDAAYDKVRRGIWGAFDGHLVGDDAVMSWLRKNPSARSAANQVISGDLAAKKNLRFEDVQDILRVMRRTATRQNKGGIRTQADKTMQSVMHLESLLDNSIPGFKEANAVWADSKTRFKGAKKLIEAIDRAIPPFSPDLPSRADGLLSTVREALSDSRTRRAAIAHMVGDAILEEGDEGIRRMEQLVKDGYFAKLFKGSVRGTPGGAALGVPGLLSINED
jgi:hypothetical protein